MAHAKNIAERYDPVTNTWETLNSMSVAREVLHLLYLTENFMRLGSGFIKRGSL